MIRLAGKESDSTEISTERYRQLRPPHCKAHRNPNPNTGTGTTSFRFWKVPAQRCCNAILMLLQRHCNAIPTEDPENWEQLIDAMSNDGAWPVVWSVETDSYGSRHQWKGFTLHKDWLIPIEHNGHLAEEKAAGS